MKDKLEISILESTASIRRILVGALWNMGRIVAILTLVISALVLFTDIGFSDFGTEGFTSTLLVMLLSSYIIYFSMEESGEKLGEQTEEYKKAIEEFSRLKNELTGEKIVALREFCRRYSLEELEYRKESFLIQNGISKDDYERYKSGDRIRWRERRVMRLAEKIRPFNLTPKILLAGGARDGQSELSNPERTKLLGLLLKLLPTTLCMLVTISVMLSAKQDLDAAGVIEGIFKLSSLPIIGFRGYAAGYSYVKDKKIFWINTKSRLLDAFLKS